METNHSTEKTFHKAFSDWLRYLSYLIDACRQLWGYSSVVEHSTADREVLGSNPSVPCHFHFQFRVASFFCILSVSHEQNVTLFEQQLTFVAQETAPEKSGKVACRSLRETANGTLILWKS